MNGETRSRQIIAEVLWPALLKMNVPGREPTRNERVLFQGEADAYTHLILTTLDEHGLTVVTKELADRSTDPNNVVISRDDLAHLTELALGGVLPQPHDCEACARLALLVGMGT